MALLLFGCVNTATGRKLSNSSLLYLCSNMTQCNFQDTEFWMDREFMKTQGFLQGYNLLPVRIHTATASGSNPFTDKQGN